MSERDTTLSDEISRRQGAKSAGLWPSIALGILVFAAGIGVGSYMTKEFLVGRDQATLSSATDCILAIGAARTKRAESITFRYCKEEGLIEF